MRICADGIRVPRALDFDENGISMSFLAKYVHLTPYIWCQTNQIYSHLAPSILTNELLPLLRKTSKSYPGIRVVNVWNYSLRANPPFLHHLC